MDIEIKESCTIEPRSKAIAIAEVANDHKALNLRILDVVGFCDYADYFVIMSAASTRQARSLAEAIGEKFSNTKAMPAKVIPEGYSNGEWILLDLQDVVVHIFYEPVRDYYNFDKLWGHVPSVESPFYEILGSMRRDVRPSM